MKPHSKRYPRGTWMRLRNRFLLRELMNTKGLSNADVAMAVRNKRGEVLGRTFVSALVNGRRQSCSVSVAQGIARRLEVPVELLFEPKTSAGGGRSNKTREKAA